VASRQAQRRSGHVVEEEERRRRFWSMVAVAEASPYTGAAMTAGRTVWFPGVVTVLTRWLWRQSGRCWCGPTNGGGGDVDSSKTRSTRENLTVCWC
jgi:hypothetical protein